MKNRAFNYFTILILLQFLLIIFITAQYNSRASAISALMRLIEPVWGFAELGSPLVQLLEENTAKANAVFTAFLHNLYSASTRLLWFANDIFTQFTLKDRVKIPILAWGGSVINGTRFWLILLPKGGEVLAWVKQILIDQNRSFFGPGLGDFFSQLVLGKFAAGRPLLQPLFNITGMQYILVVSGFHLSLLVRTVIVSLHSIFNRMQVAAIAIFLIAAYYVLVGQTPSLLRASVMLIFSILARHAWLKQYRAGYFFGLMIAVIILIDREILTSVSFQMSAAATAGIIFLIPLFSRGNNVIAALENADIAWVSLEGGLAAKYLRLVNNGFWVSVAANLALAPLLLHYFGEINLISIAISSILFWLAPVLVASSWLLTWVAALASRGKLINMMLLPAKQTAAMLIMAVETAMAPFTEWPLIIKVDDFKFGQVFWWWAALSIYILWRQHTDRQSQQYQRLTL